MISIYIIEDNENVLYLLRQLIEKNTDFHLVGFSKLGKDANVEIIKTKPDVVLVDIGLPDISGIDCIRYLKPKMPETEFIVCTIFEDEEEVFDALEAGASSYILKNAAPHFLLDSIREVINGGSTMSPDIARKIVQHFYKRNNVKEEYHITNKESEVLKLLSKGNTYQEIASLLFIKISTLKKHIYNIYDKLQVDNRTEAINKFYGPK